MTESGVFELENPEGFCLKQKPAVVRGPGLAVIRASGADTLAFFDRIFTNRVSAIKKGGMISGWADAKGRLIAAPQLVRAGEDALYLLVPRDTAETLMKKLRLYIFRSKVILEDVTEKVRPVAVLGTEEGVRAELEKAGLSLPGAPWGVMAAGAARVLRLPDARDGVPLFAGAPVRALVLSGSDALEEAAPDESLWWLSEIAAEVPSIFAGAVGKFVPQGVGLERFGGVSFNKGCYPGQELISRVQHNMAKFGKGPAVTRTAEAVPAAGEALGEKVVVLAVKAGAETFALVQAPAAGA